MLRIDIESVALLLEDDRFAFRAIVISLEPHVGIGRNGMRPAAQNVATGNIKIIMDDPEKIRRIARIKSSENLVDITAVSVSLDSDQILIRDIPIEAKTPAAQLPGVVGRSAIG